MISFFEASLRSLSVHRVGNKTMDEFYILSEEGIKIEEDQSSLLLKYFLSPFEKVNQIYNLFHSSDIHLNQVYEIITTNIGESAFHEASKQLAKHLFEISNHPKIRSGEFYTAFFENIQFQGELFNAVGIFKSELKDTYLKVNTSQTGFDLEFEQNAININKLDKGCLILNKNIPDGCTVLCIDSNGKDSSYWMDEFLGLKIISNDYHQTGTMINICKTFVRDHLDNEFDISEAAKADLLNKSLNYFKEKEVFDLEEYTSEVLNNERAAESFKKYKSIYDEEFDSNISASFEISSASVKKNSKAFKPIIKLDKNFHLYVHGKQELLEKGFDEDKGMSFYKLYFKEETL